MHAHPRKQQEGLTEIDFAWHPDPEVCVRVCERRMLRLVLAMATVNPQTMPYP